MPSDEDYVSNNYIAHPDYILCTVAQDHDGTLLGLPLYLGLATALTGG